MINPIVYSWPQGPRRWTLNETVSTAPWSYRVHRHEGFCDLTLVCEGQIENVANEEATSLTAGTVSWTRERDLHRLEGQDFRYLNMNLSEDQLRLMALSLGREKEFEGLRRQKNPPWVQLGSRAVGVEAEWMRLFNRPHAPGAELLAYQLALGVLVELMTPLLQKRVTKKADRPEWLERGILHIDRCLEDGVSVSELAEVCGRSAEHVSRSFTKYLGMSPSSWINRQRLTRAALLLSSTNREILEVCYSVGFQSASYFYRLFRGTYAMAPRQYRKKYHPMPP